MMRMVKGLGNRCKIGMLRLSFERALCIQCTVNVSIDRNGKYEAICVIHEVADAQMLHLCYLNEYSKV